MELTSTRESPALWDNDYWEKVRQRTLKVIACIPRDKFDWRYAEGKFSFADIIRHLATIERYMYAENVQLKPSSYPGHGPELADGQENVMAFFNRLHQESVAVFSRLSADDLQKKCVTPGGTPITVWKWLRAMVEHEIEFPHRYAAAQDEHVMGLEVKAQPRARGTDSHPARAWSR